jgi:hypothetical protein
VSQSDKSALFQALKGAGVEFTKHYREYTTADLQKKYDELVAVGAISVPEPEPAVQYPPTEDVQPFVPTAGEEMDPDAAAFFGFEPAQPSAPEPQPQPTYPGRTDRDPNTFAGEHLNSKPLDEPLRTDEQGRTWFQEEVRKPATPQPRGRRVLQYVNSGTEMKSITLEDGTVESFEVAGRGTRTAEVKITLPSYQVGIFKDPRFPFKVFTYGGVNGFDFFEVQEFYGGPELVPASIKRMYVANVLCYDIRTTVQAIEAEARQLALQGRIQL